MRIRASLRLTKNAAALLLLLLLLAAPVAARAQGVSGQLSLVERPGAGRCDVQTAVVYLEAAGSVVRPAASSAAAPVPEALLASSIAMRGREFVPHVRAVLAGGSVAFPNRDPFSHNVFSNADPGPFDLGLYRRGASRAASFARPGVYPIYCNIHSKMVSFVVAVPTPYVTHAGPDGRFAIPNAPPGTYLLRVWHECAGAIATREITIPGGGLSGVRVTLDARAYVAAPHLNKFGLPYSATRADRY